MLDVIEAIIVY